MLWAQRPWAGGIAIIDPIVFKLGAALGIGLLIGVERERRKGSGASRAPAGIRTFAVASLAAIWLIFASLVRNANEIRSSGRLTSPRNRSVTRLMASAIDT